VSPAARIFIIAGIILVIVGILVNFGLGRLPGDIYIRKENFTFYFPLASSIVVSVIVTLIVLLLRR